MVLLNGSTANEGRVEMYKNGTWGTLCDNSWDINGANVVCRMLGFPRAISAFGYAQFGQGKGVIWHVSCNGNETNIGECHHSRSESRNCDHERDAGVTCGKYTITC